MSDKIEQKPIENRPGVYRVLNTATGDFYVGSASNLRTRKNHHFHKLEKQRHVNKFLQKAYDKYGKDSFIFEILEFCDKESLIDREQHYIDSLQPIYNSSPVAGSQEGFEHSFETRMKISETMRKSKGLPTDKTRAPTKARVLGGYKLRTMDKNSIRNLAPYRDKTDEEFDIEYEALKLSKETKADFEVLIKDKMKKFEEDYDLTDMKFNDLETLRALCQAQVFLELFEQESFMAVQEITTDNLMMLDRLEIWKKNLRESISRLQEDLQITRKNRKGESSQSVLEEIEKMKATAKEFYEQKMAFIFCPECDMLLSTIWVLWPDVQNDLVTRCKRCKKSHTIKLKEIYARGLPLTNKPERMPPNL